MNFQVRTFKNFWNPFFLWNLRKKRECDLLVTTCRGVLSTKLLIEESNGRGDGRRERHVADCDTGEVAPVGEGIVRVLEDGLLSPPGVET